MNNKELKQKLSRIQSKQELNKEISKDYEK